MSYARDSFCGCLLLAGFLASGTMHLWSAEAGGPAASMATDSALREQASSAMLKGLDWLKTHQKDNGAWSDTNYPGLTALGLWAAARSGRPDLAEVRNKAATFIAGWVQPDGGIYKPATGGRGTGGLSIYNTALCMVALHSHDRGKYTPAILRAREYLASGQVQGDSAGAGGFGYERPSGNPRERADLSNTGWSLMAMRATQDVEDLRPKTARTVDVDWASALKFVTSLQQRDEQDPVNDGGFGYEGGGERSSPSAKSTGAVALRGFGSMTYAGIESMIYAQVDRNDPRVRSAVDWASRHWSVDENPGMDSKGLFYYYNIMGKALSLMGDEALKMPDGKLAHWRQDLVGKLQATQRPDGSWANSDNTFWENDPALVTAYAVLTLQSAMWK